MFKPLASETESPNVINKKSLTPFFNITIICSSSKITVFFIMYEVISKCLKWRVIVMARNKCCYGIISRRIIKEANFYGSIDLSRRNTKVVLT